MTLSMLLCTGVLLTAPAPQDSAAPVVSAALRARLVEAVAETITDNYVFVDRAKEIASELRERAAAGRYDGASDAWSLSRALTEDLQPHDRHFGVRWRPDASVVVAEEPDADRDADDEEEHRVRRRMLSRGRAANHGVHGVSILPGNVGLLDYRGFWSGGEAHATFAAAMGVLAHTDAVIVDLRQNGGGDPDMVREACSWFFGQEPVLVNTIYYRPDNETQEFWTRPRDGGRPEVPLWVLTSARTGSGAEEFAYDIQTQARGVLVGEVTAGAANPGDTFPLGDGFTIFVSTGTAINPITGINWETTGVTPDVEVDAGLALDRAHRDALATLLERTADASEREVLTWAIDGLAARLDPITLSPTALEGLVGHYGPRRTCSCVMAARRSACARSARTPSHSRVWTCSG